MRVIYRSVWCGFCLMALSLSGLTAPVADAPGEMVVRDEVPGSNGTVVLWRRMPATTQDLNLPIAGGAIITDSLVYRIRDRKHRDLLRYSRMVLTTAEPVTEVVALYRRALGTAVQEETDTDGVLTLTSGERVDLRLVTIAPKTGYCDIRLERSQRFTVPPRTYTEEEQRVLRVLQEVAATYRSAAHVAYTMAQHLEPAEGTNEQPPTLTWTVDFTPPASLRVRAAMGEALGLSITTRDGKLVIARPGKPDEARPFIGALTALDLPELADDPVACMMLGDNLVTAEVDYLMLQAVPGLPAHQQVEVVLTQPEDHATVHLRIDRQRNVVLQSDIVVTTEDGRTMRMIRRYSNLIVEPTPTAAPSPAREGAPPPPSR